MKRQDLMIFFALQKAKNKNRLTGYCRKWVKINLTTESEGNSPHLRQYPDRYGQPILTTVQQTN
jgi:hypothetical protein